MRKVLLATTALVALGGVSAASAADVTLSGKTMFNATTWSDNVANTSNNNDTKTDVSFEVDVTASATTDNGLTWSTNIDLHDSSNGKANMSISGDFGTVYFSVDGDGDGDAFATSADPVADEDTGDNTVTFNGGEQVDGGKMSYKSSAINGFSFAIGYSDAGSDSKADASSYGVSYSTTAAGAAVTVQYAASSANLASGLDGTDATSLGLKASVGDIGVILAQNTKEVKSGATVSNDYKGNGVSVTYKVSDQMSLALQTMNADDGASTYEYKQNAASVSYTIGAGMAAHLSVTDFDQKGTSAFSGTSTELEIAVSF